MKRSDVQYGFIFGLRSVAKIDKDDKRVMKRGAKTKKLKGFRIGPGNSIRNPMIQFLGRSKVSREK